MIENKKVEEKKFDDKINYWNELLHKVVNKKHEPHTTVFVLGNKKCGKTHLFDKFTDRYYSKDISEYLLDYSYINVKHHDDDIDDETVSRIHLWQSNFEDKSDSNTGKKDDDDDDNKNDEDSKEPQTPRDHHNNMEAQLFKPFFKNYNDAKHCCFIIIVDFSKPSTIKTSLELDMKVLHTIVNKFITPGLKKEEIRSLKRSVSSNIQFYNVDDTNSEQKNKNEEIKVDESIPAINLGVPIMIVGTKMDAYKDHYNPKNEDIGQKYDYLTRYLRNFALQHGASLAYTSSFKKTNDNIQALQQYIYHRFYNFEFTHKPSIVSNILEDDWNIFIPAGYDSEELLKLLNSAIPQDRPFEDVFQQKPKPKPIDQIEIVKAQRNDLFFASLKFAQENPVEYQVGKHRGSSKKTKPRKNSHLGDVEPKRHSTKPRSHSKSGKSPHRKGTSGRKKRDPSSTTKKPKKKKGEKKEVKAFLQNLLSKINK